MTDHADVTNVHLPNGLQVLLREDRSAPIVSTWTWYRVGSRNEVPGLTGVSHWVEHMQFKGTPSLAKGQIFRDVSRHGGVLNAMTSHDWTAYFETLPSEQADLSLRIESDRMVNSLYDPEETESERTVILSERQGSENHPGYQLYEEVVGAAFRSHPYGHMVIGHEADLRAITRDDLYRHYRAHYVPNNAIVVAVGDFDRDAMLGKIEQSFAPIPAGDVPPKIRAVEPQQRSERRVLIRRPSPAVYLRMAYHAPDARHPDTAALLVADAVLSGGKGMGLASGGAMGRSSRLYRALVDGRLARSAGSDFDLTIDPYLFSVAATALEGVEPERIEAAIDRELRRLRDELVPDDELARARRQVRAQYVYSGEGVTNQAFWLGQMEIVDRWQRAATLVDELEAVTPDDLQRVARAWLRPEARTVGWLVPSADSGGEDPDSGSDRLYRVWGLNGQGAPFERAQLANGAVLLGQARPAEPAVSVRVRVEAGAVVEPAASGGTATMTARMLTRGGGGLTATAINELTDSLGASISSDAGRRSAELSFRCLSEDLPAMLGLAGRLLRHPDFPPDELEKVRDQLLVGIRESENDTRATADRLLRRSVYPEPNPLGRRVAGDAESVRGIVRDDLATFHHAAYAPSRTTVAVVGGVPSFVAAREMVDEAFGPWTGAGTRSESGVPGVSVVAGEPSRVESEIAGKVQADVAIGWPTIPRSHPDYYALDLANLVLGRLGLMGRLGANVRDRQGLAYYAFSQIEADREGSLWTARAGVDPANIDRAVAAVRDEVARLRADGVTDEELDDAKNFLVGILPLTLETNDGVAATLLNIEYFGLGLDYLDRYPSIVRALTADDVRTAAQRHLDEARTVVAVAKPASGG